MKTTMQEVRTFRIMLYCDCGADMQWTGTSLTTNPPIFPHVCTDPECGKTIQEKQQYPYDVQIDVGDEQELPDEE